VRYFVSSLFEILKMFNVTVKKLPKKMDKSSKMYGKLFLNKIQFFFFSFINEPKYSRLPHIVILGTADTCDSYNFLSFLPNLFFYSYEKIRPSQKLNMIHQRVWKNSQKQYYATVSVIR